MLKVESRKIYLNYISVIYFIYSTYAFFAILQSSTSTQSFYFICELISVFILSQGKEIILHYVNELLNQGVTFIAPFESSKGRPRVLSTIEKQSSIERPEIDERIESEDEGTPEEPTLQPPHSDLKKERIQEAAEPPPLQGIIIQTSLFIDVFKIIKFSFLAELRLRIAKRELHCFDAI